MERTVKTLKWLVISLVLMNTALLCFTFYNRPGQNHPPFAEKDRRGPGALLIRELELDEKQIEKFELLKEEHHSQVGKYLREGKQFRDLMFEKLHTTASPAEVSALADSIASKQKAIEVLTFYHFSMVRELCSEQQKKKFDEIIGDVLRSMARPPHPEQRP